MNVYKPDNPKQNGQHPTPLRRHAGHVDEMTTTPAPSPLPTCQLCDDSTQPSKKTDALTHASRPARLFDEFRSILARISEQGRRCRGQWLTHKAPRWVTRTASRWPPAGRPDAPDVPPTAVREPPHGPHTNSGITNCYPQNTPHLPRQPRTDSRQPVPTPQWSRRTAPETADGPHANERKVCFTGPRKTRWPVLERLSKECNKRSSFGHGTYFAKDASYSLSGYAPPTHNADQYLLVNDVLVGSMDHRNGGRRASPLVDTTVDSTLHPTIFCVHQNDRAIPRYLVHMNASVAKARANYKTFMSDTLPKLLTTQELDRRIRGSSLGVRGWAGEGGALCGS